MAATATYDLPFQGYDDLDGRRLNAQLRLRSQVELTRIDEYERSHQERPAVLEKLRYLRNDEPLDGYDGLDTDEILVALADSDVAKLKSVRGYEVKLRDREDLLDGLEKLRKKRTPQSSDAATDQPVERWPGDDTGGLKGFATTVAVFGIMAFAAVLLLIAAAVLLYVILTAVAPDVLIG